MLRLGRIVKNYREAGALNAQLNLYGFVDDQVFLTKTGDVGVILEVRGVDYECLDGSSIDALTKRLESALRLFDDNYRLYQYLFKRNNPCIPHRLYGNPVVDAAISSRMAYLRAKSGSLFSLSIYYAVLYEPRNSVGDRFLSAPTNAARILETVRRCWSTKARVLLLDRELTRARSSLLEKVGSFLLQVADFLPARILDKQEAFRVLTQMINFAPQKIECARLKHDTFLDYFLGASHLECHRTHLRVDDYFVKILTKLPAHFQTSARSAGELLCGDRVEEGRIRKNQARPPGQAAPL
jgi:type IV secretion system protein TrbE